MSNKLPTNNNFFNNTRGKKDFGHADIVKSPPELLSSLKISELEAAPSDWNFYKPLNDDKMEELLESILDKGLLVPIIVWQSNSKYMILSGHNRVKAYKLLRESTGDNKYDEISAFIKHKEEIDENTAREIIIDTNWVQRTLSPMERAKSILEKYTVLERKNPSDSKYNEHGKGRTRDIIGRQFEMSGTTIELYRSLNSLISELKELVNNGKITLKVAYKLSLFDEDVQKWILDNHKDKLKASYIHRVNRESSIEEIEELFKEISDLLERETIKLNIPKSAYLKYNELSFDEKIEFEKKVVMILKEK